MILTPTSPDLLAGPLTPVRTSGEQGPLPVDTLVTVRICDVVLPAGATIDERTVLALIESLKQVGVSMN